MIEASAFQTRARTVDHLGREQIADCPTAISELWKNAFDAYARSVDLTIFPGIEGGEPAAVIADDGHGMNRADFLSRWLVVGTESKETGEETTAADRNGLPLRPRQGQKGIGRLSCANLGQTLLLVSKRRTDPFVAALVDWRLFQNPLTNLSDIFIPITEFSSAGDLFGLLPNLAASLAENVTGGRDKERSKRLRSAWRAFDELQEHAGGHLDPASTKPSVEILSAISALPYRRHHLQAWPVFTGNSEHGTALLIARINHDLKVHLEGEDGVGDTAGKAARARFFETLSSFVDPFVDPAGEDSDAKPTQITYTVRTWSPTEPRVVLGSEKQFDKRQIDQMEHRLDGIVDADGVFLGRVRAFGEWLPDECAIPPPKDLVVPRRRNTAVGPFEFYLASMEFKRESTTHTDPQFEHYRDLASKFSGFMVFRDGLRVLPYGRTDNDFFEIEERRSKHVGREFWNHRQMFGRIAITREANPNLRDKAGREGLIDNRAAKVLRDLVANILMESARRYFGSASPLRKELLPPITAANRKKRAAVARQRLRQRHRREFRRRLRDGQATLAPWLLDVERYVATVRLNTEQDLTVARGRLEEFRQRLADFRLMDVPDDLAGLEEAYAQCRKMVQNGETLTITLRDKIERRVSEIQPKDPARLLEKQLADQAFQLEKRLLEWQSAINDLQTAERHRLKALLARSKNSFRQEAKPLIERFRLGRLPFQNSSRLMDSLKQRVEQESHDVFAPYLDALQSLHDDVDLVTLARVGLDELGDLHGQIDRLNSLAQLGIAVEITAHELQAYDDMIGNGLRALPQALQDTDSVKEILLGYEGLTDQLRFLSPLRLAGTKTQRWIRGSDIGEYVRRFFGTILERTRVRLVTTPEFLSFRVFDYQSRLYPVFINLVNNSLYWLSTADNEDRRIVLGIVGNEVVVSDNGPGVDSADTGHLFQLFFTRKMRGGRGVGLYLCRANLAAGGHTIRYEPTADGMPLSGANFLIKFNGAEIPDG